MYLGLVQEQILLLNTYPSLWPLKFSISYTFNVGINDITKGKSKKNVFVLACGSRDKVHNYGTPLHEAVKDDISYLTYAQASEA